MAKEKEKSSVSLPKAWKSVKHSNDMKSARENFKDIGGIIAGIILALLIAFILLGGINQRGFVEAIFQWSDTVGHKISQWIEDSGIEVTDDGIYVNPNGIGLGNSVNDAINTDPYNNEVENSAENSLPENNAS